ncbi:MAG: DegT/DnrJ/EryC1/StrS family aminotransferase [Pirellulaceae bacterium]|nr:DegT/DnrJ/EryC1/StrS family aminotransferase [Pirellulaceae bacterium]
MIEKLATQVSLPQLPSDQDASGRTLGDEEIRLLADVIEKGVLTSTKGNYVREFEQKFAQRLGVKHAYCTSHGTAALHVAYAAIDPEPGDEFITTSITDMGALTPILYQGAIPVFCDVDPRTLNVTAETIERAISPRTKAIIVTHLFGQPCDMGPIMELAIARGIPVIEDCAQAFGASYKGRAVGTMGDIACFSLQQGKHITTGEGGVVVTNRDDLGRRSYLYINKAWGYGDPKPDHYFLALNYRMNELTGAVALAQLGKLDMSVDSRVERAHQLTKSLRGLPGIGLPDFGPEYFHTFWKYCLTVDDSIVPGGAVGLAKILKEQYGIFSAPRYIQKPAFRCQIFAERVTFGKSQFPFTLARPEALDYSERLFPGTFKGLNDVLVLPWNENYTRQHVAFIADSIKASLETLKG